MGFRRSASGSRAAPLRYACLSAHRLVATGVAGNPDALRFAPPPPQAQGMGEPALRVGPADVAVEFPARDGLGAGRFIFLD